MASRWAALQMQGQPLIDAPGNSACYAEWSVASAGPHGQSLEWLLPAIS